MPVQGDLERNCLVRDGRLGGIVHWGLACAGDPELDDARLARSRGVAVNQACAALPYYLHTYPLIVERSCVGGHGELPTGGQSLPSGGKYAG